MSIRALLLFDIICASLGLAAYAVFFGLLTETLNVPAWLVYLHMAANGSYALFGTSIYLGSKGDPAPKRFKTLASANIYYSIFALVLAALMTAFGAFWAAALLVSEGVVVCALGLYERATYAKIKRASI